MQTEQPHLVTPPPLPEPPAPVKRWRWWVHLLIIGGYPLGIALMSMSRPRAKGAVLTGDARSLIIICLLEMVLFGLVLGLGVLASRARSKDLWLPWRGTWRPLGWGFLYALGVRLAVGISFVAVFSVIGSVLIAAGKATPESLAAYVEHNKPDVESVIDVDALKNNPAYFWLSLTLVSFVMAGLREELWRSATLAGFRHLWPDRFNSGRGQFVAVLMISIVFGIGHLQQGILGVAMTAFIGACLGAVMIRHQSIWPAVFAHGFFDATSMAMLPLVVKHVH